jgi:hypothetical protein
MTTIKLLQVMKNEDVKIFFKVYQTVKKGENFTSPISYNHMKKDIFGKIMKNGAFFVFTACSESL